MEGSVMVDCVSWTGTAAVKGINVEMSRLMGFIWPMQIADDARVRNLTNEG